MRDFESIFVTQSDGVTELRLHTDGGPLIWNASAHREMPVALSELAGDRDTRVVIITGTGDSFCVDIDGPSFAKTPGWERIWWEGKRLIKGLLDLDVPVIGAVNGPAHIHSEILLLSDIALAADTATFSDKAHIPDGVVPGDGMHLVWPWLLGPRRAKYFFLMEQELSAGEALELGVVNEVVPAADLSERAWSIAQRLASKPLHFLRYTREVLNVFEREHLLSALSHGLALEGVSLADDGRAAGETGGR